MQALRSSEGQAGLASPTRAADGEQAVVPQRRGDVGELAFPTYEAGQLPGQATTAGRKLSLPDPGTPV